MAKKALFNWYVVPLLVTILSIVLASMVFVDENEQTEELKMAQKAIAGLLIGFTVIGFYMGSGGLVMGGEIKIINSK